MVFSRIKWQPDDSENRLRILTPLNLDCIFEICGGDGTNVDPYLKLISVAKVDNLHTDIDELDSGHYYFDPFLCPAMNVTDRLIRMSQSYAVDMQHALNLDEYPDEYDFRNYMLEHIQRIDYF